MATIQIKRGLQASVDSLTLLEGELALAKDTGNLYVGTDSGKVHVNPTGGTADTAAKLSTARNFSVTGDATAPAVSFDGTDDVALALTLKTISGLTAGTYAKVTVDAKGRVTKGTALAISDLPNNIPTTKITGLGTAASKDTGSESGKVVEVQSDGKILSSLLPDLSGTYIAISAKGVAGGVATLGNDGKIPTSQLPSYVDDVVEFDKKSSFPETGEDGKIYVAKDTNIIYRWSGSAYVEISASLALGTTASTAFAGDKGQTAYEHSQLTTGNPHNVTAAQVGAAPSSHTSAVATSSAVGHVKPGVGLSVATDGTLNIGTIDGGTF